MTSSAVITTGLMSIILLSACASMQTSAESSYYYSVVPEETGEVSFDLDMSDSSSVYSVSVFARFAKKFSHRYVTLQIEAVSPSGTKGYETVVFPSDRNSVKNYIETSGDSRIELAGTSGYYDICWKYRENIYPEEKGQWQLKIAVPDTITDITGIGAILERTPVAKQ